MRKPVTVLVTDLDNTLWDWVQIWHRSFSALLDTLIEQSGVERETLERQMRAVHQRHGTSEYAFVINETPALKKKHPGKDLKVVYAAAIDAYRSARRQALTLYPGVLDTLRKVHDAGSLIVAYTESMAFYTGERVRKLGLDGVIDFLYSPPDHDLPQGMTADELRLYPRDHYEFAHTKHRHTPRGALKPDPTILSTILDNHRATRARTIYVGDSVMKDIAMAQEARVPDVWAKYGTAQDRPEYALLRRVSHWPDESVERERRLMHEMTIKPTYTLPASFEQLLDIFEFCPHEPGGGHAG